MKESLKGTRFDAVEAVKEKTMETINMLSEKDLKHCLEQWKILMKICKDSGGYIEVDKVQVEKGKHIKSFTSKISFCFSSHISYIFLLPRL